MVSIRLQSSMDHPVVVKIFHQDPEINAKIKSLEERLARLEEKLENEQK